MINGTFKYPEIRLFGYLPKRIPEPSETRFSDNSVTYGFNDACVCSHGSGWCDSQIRMETEKQIINN